jgi:predicted MFS family arabinose efflux permease
VSHGFDVAGVANAMSAWAFVGVLGSFSVGLLPESVPRWVLIGTGLLVMLGGYYALYSPPSVLVYAIGCAIGGFYWNFILPLMLGLLARVDASGRGSVWGGSMSSMGSMLGPVIAGMLISGTDYMPVATTSIALTVAGFACVFLIERGRVVAG